MEGDEEKKSAVIFRLALLPSFFDFPLLRSPSIFAVSDLQDDEYNILSFYSMPTRAGLRLGPYRDDKENRGPSSSSSSSSRFNGPSSAAASANDDDDDSGAYDEDEGTSKLFLSL